TCSESCRMEEWHLSKKRALQPVTRSRRHKTRRIKFYIAFMTAILLIISCAVLVMAFGAYSQIDNDQTTDATTNSFKTHSDKSKAGEDATKQKQKKDHHDARAQEKADNNEAEQADANTQQLDGDSNESHIETTDETDEVVEE